MKLAAWTADDYYVKAISTVNCYVPAKTSLMKTLIDQIDIPVNRELFYTTADDSYPCECSSTYGTDAEIITRYLGQCLSAQVDIQPVLDQCAAELTASRKKAING